MTDETTDVQVKQLQSLLDAQIEAKELAYFDLANRNRRVDELEEELAKLDVAFVRECARTSNLSFEVALYRDRYHETLMRISSAGRAITIANAARDYLAAIERRGSLEGDVVASLERLREEVGFSLDADVNPLYEIIYRLETELEALRRRSAELIDERDALAARLEEAEGKAADWQELAETNDRQLVVARNELRRWELNHGD
jgi:chromosome segregation ATPase